ncbi:hypothetical protein [Microbacterium foliorum]|uniref:hypothetical protein n=1 Tax=Microbacterium foliorum TaxID=104336 RepID=UPI003736B440
MTSLPDLSAFIVPSARSEFLRRIETVSGTRYDRAEASRRLKGRLDAWEGAHLPSETGRSKHKVPLGATVLVESEEDDAELMILRVIASTRGDAQFTVSPNGAVFSTMSNGWTINKGRICVSGLSPLLDDAADLLNRIRNGSGGRMFFTEASIFMDASTRKGFLRVHSARTTRQSRHSEDHL